MLYTPYRRVLDYYDVLREARKVVDARLSQGLPSLIYGLDISNYDGTLDPSEVECWQQHGIGHVAVRLSLESAEMIAIGRQQLGVLAQVGMPASGYEWGYGTWDPVWTAQQTMDKYGDVLPLHMVWSDIEDVSSFAQIGQAASVQWLSANLGTFDAAGWLAGNYSAAWCWVPITGGSTAFADRRWWIAEYDDNPDFTVFAPVGGVQRPIGKQYIGNGSGARVCNTVADLDAFDASALFPAPAPVPEPVPEVIDQRLRDVMAWRMGGINQAAKLLDYYSDPNNVPTEVQTREWKHTTTLSPSRRFLTHRRPDLHGTSRSLSRS